MPRSPVCTVHVTGGGDAVVPHHEHATVGSSGTMSSVTPTTTSRAWNTAIATGLLRVVVGFALVRWRGPLARRLAGASEGDRLLPVLFGYFGVRDMTVGVVTLA